MALWFHQPQNEELDLDFERTKKPLVFPDHLFMCATLTKFQLSMQHIFNLPSSVRFESLRTLTLDHITFPDCSSTQQLLSGCPSLEELSLINCNWVNVKNVCISPPMLQKLIINDQSENDDTESDEDDDIGGQNVSSCCKVVIIGTNLKSFSYDGLPGNDFVLYDSTSVINASIKVHIPEYIWRFDWETDAAVSVFGFLKELSNVEKLTICETVFMAFNKAAYLLGHLPLFCNLDEVHLLSPAYSPIRCSSESLLTILRNSPYLRAVHFDTGGIALPEDCVNNNHILDPLPVCFKTHLKTIKIWWFSGSEEELNGIKILLQAASVLDILYIYCYFDDFESPKESKRLKKLYECIVRFPKASIDCKITFEYS